MPDETPPIRVNAGYALSQLQKALTAAGGVASSRVRAWQEVITGLLDGSLRPGSRTPVEGAPPWVTLEVVHGGFATGAFAAAGPLQEHERQRLANLEAPDGGTDRAAINLSFLGDEGRAELGAMLASGGFRIQVPEEAALLVWAWLLERAGARPAAELLDAIMPWFGNLRFYPVPDVRPRLPRDAVFVSTAGQAIETLQAVRPKEAVETMREALLVWTPLYDRSVALFLETVEGAQPDLRRDASGALVRAVNGQPMVEGGWPCRTFAGDWPRRARALLADYEKARAGNQRSRKPERPKENFALLRGYLATCAVDPAAMTPRDVGMVRKIVAAHVAKHGAPGSERLSATRTRQRLTASAPAHSAIARVVAGRLAAWPPDEGVSDLGAVLGPLVGSELRRLGIEHDPTPAVTIPPSVAARARRCLAAPIGELVSAGLLPSSESLAWTLPMVTAKVRAGAVADPALRRVYEDTYLAFRRRRSLLLLDLESQVRLEELPWVAAVRPWVGSDQASRDAARETLTETAVLAMGSFPQTILPNRLIKELRALAGAAKVEIPLVDELAADIFMGAFSGTFVRAAQVAGDLLRGSIYERYYGIAYERVATIDDVVQRGAGPGTSPAFAAMCRQLAGEADRQARFSVPWNGKVIEQEQILTTHNLAALWKALDLGGGPLRERLGDLGFRCFAWVCRSQQADVRGWQPKLRAVKNSAYAWRQMLFFASLMDPGQLADFRARLRGHFAEQPPGFRERFSPAVAGLLAVLDGDRFDSAGWHRASGGRRFLGWTADTHWLLR